MDAKIALGANIGLRLIGEYVKILADGEAREHYNALVTRLQAVEDEHRRAATTTIDADGNITIGLKPLSMAAEPVKMR